MTPNPKDDLIKKTILGMKMVDFALNNPEVYNYIRQQTAQEIFKDKEIRISIFDLLPDEVILAFPKCKEFELEVILPVEIKQKYLGDKK